MSVKKVSDLSPQEGITLRDAGLQFINSYRGSLYQESYVTSLEETISYLALYAEEQGWPAVRHITTEHLEEYFVYSRTRPKYYGERSHAYGDQTLSSSYLNRNYRQLHCFWGWLVKRGFAAENALAGMNPPRVEENIVPTVTDEQIAVLLALVNPQLARTRLDVFRLRRNRALLLLFVDTPGRLQEIAAMKLDDKTQGKIHLSPRLADGTMNP